MTPAQLQEIRQRVEKATEGKWFCRKGSWKTVIECDGITIAEISTYTHGSEADDSQFIAHARQDIPALLDEVERLRGALKMALPHYKMAAIMGDTESEEIASAIIQAISENAEG